jgi:predicted amidophosphoribosyltransferase
MESVLDFFLHKYDVTKSMSYYDAPYKFRNPLWKEYKESYKDSWNNHKKEICNQFIDKLEQIYKKDETFLLFIAPTKNENRFFIQDIINTILHNYTNAINLSEVFYITDEKKDNNANVIQTSPSRFVGIREDRFLFADKYIDKAFIVDDIYNTGGTMELTKRLITKYLDRDLEIHNGVILKLF